MTMSRQQGPPPTEAVLPRSHCVQEKRYFWDFFLHEHLSAGLLQPEQTPSTISLPHFLHGEHPHS
jgi:hypothetical protein